MFFCILFNYTILRDTKDVLVVTSAGAEIIPFLKTYVQLPSAIQSRHDCDPCKDELCPKSTAEQHVSVTDIETREAMGCGGGGESASVASATYQSGAR